MSWNLLIVAALTATIPSQMPCPKDGFTEAEWKFMTSPMNNKGTFEPLVWATRLNTIDFERAAKNAKPKPTCECFDGHGCTCGADCKCVRPPKGLEQIQYQDPPVIPNIDTIWRDVEKLKKDVAELKNLKNGDADPWKRPDGFKGIDGQPGDREDRKPPYKAGNGGYDGDEQWTELYARVKRTGHEYFAVGYAPGSRYVSYYFPQGYRGYTTGTYEAYCYGSEGLPMTKRVDDTQVMPQQSVPVQSVAPVAVGSYPTTVQSGYPWNYSTSSSGCYVDANGNTVCPAPTTATRSGGTLRVIRSR